MDFFQLVNTRESCRDFDPARPVETELLLKMTEAARLAPSACNSQPWHFTVVNTPETCAALAPTLQGLGMNKFTSACPAFIVINEEEASLSAKVGSRFKKQDFSQIDIGIACAHLVFAARELGLSTCILGWFSEPALKAVTGIAEDKRIRLVIAVGYAKSDTLREKKRKSAEEVVTVL